MSRPFLAALVGLLLSTRAGAAPKLVVFLVVDQLRADAVATFGADWSAGLRRLFDRGAWLRNARAPYLATGDCAGHFTISTGAYPHRHGMVLDTWYERESHRVVECTDDPGAPLVTHPATAPMGGDSAKNLLVPTLADEMQRQLARKPRLASFSLKARGAVGLAGHFPATVVWFDGSHWVTSTAFAPEPIAWLTSFVAAHPPDLTVPWTELLPRYHGPDDVAAEQPGLGWTRTFPHRLDGSPALPLGRWADSPAADDYLIDLASTALRELDLGHGPGTDVLALSFTPIDVIGHQFGPRSRELEDALARLDRAVGKLLDALDARVPDDYVVVFTADHGVANLPEQSGTVGESSGRLLPAVVRRAAEAALAKELGRGKHVAQVHANELYLLPGAHEKLVAKEGAVDRVLAALTATPGIARAFDRAQLAPGARCKDPVCKAAALGHHPARSGDLVLVPQPNWVFGPLATNHGSAHDYDQRVPLVFLGKGIKPGKYDAPASLADVAPTLARLVGVRLPHAEGAPLASILRAR